MHCRIVRILKFLPDLDVNKGILERYVVSGIDGDVERVQVRSIDAPLGAEPRPEQPGLDPEDFLNEPENMLRQQRASERLARRRAERAPARGVCFAPRCRRGERLGDGYRHSASL